MNLESKIFVSGHRGLVGSAVVRLLQSRGYNKILTADRSQLNLLNELEVKDWFANVRPEYVFHCAARVGGLKDNIENPIEFFSENLAIQSNVIGSAAAFDVKKLLFLGSSCIYPVDCRRPMKEEYLMTGPFEEAVEPYGLAKMCGVKLCQWYRQAEGKNFVSALPCNLYGKNDRINPETSHVIPGLLYRMRSSRRKKGPFEIWGNGLASREVLFVDDLAEALLLIMLQYDDYEPINAGSGEEFSVRQIAERCAKTVDYRARLIFDDSAPTGTENKCLDNSKLFSLGWRPKVSLDEGLQIAYADMRTRLRAFSAKIWRDSNPERSAEIKKKSYDKNREKRRATFKIRYHANREKELARHREIKYGITASEYEARVREQEGKCAICGRPETCLQVDHCHKTGKIRGLLCGSCNKALGLMRDLPERMRAGADYLIKSQG